MRIHVLQHTSETPPGTVLEWAKARHLEVKVTRLYASEPLPQLSEVDWLILLGGGINVDEVDKNPWLPEEKRFVEAAIKEGKTVLGLCLGGQMIAQVLGATVKKHEHWEVGWHPIHIGTDARREAGQGERLVAFQWHEDTFDIPSGAIRIASSQICLNQGFAYGDHVVGLQFHPEATLEWIEECAATAPEEYPIGAHVQSPEAIRENMVFHPPMQNWFFSLLDRLTAVTHQHQAKMNHDRSK